jgi:SAM-dependent methyltransferase
VEALSERRLRARDAALQAAADDLLAHDRRVAGTAVTVSFDRGVAHLSGESASPAELDVIRRLIGRLDGVLAVWDRVIVNGRQPTIVDLGCGRQPQYSGAIGVDLRPGPGVTHVADLNQGIPLDSESAETIFAVHILEHLPNYLPLLDECHRVLARGGILHIMAPWWRHVNAVADPTHVRLFDLQTIKHICTLPDRPGWTPLHAGCDGASVFADLQRRERDEPLDDLLMARFFN